MSDKILVEAIGVKKKFCRSLKKSLWYGVKDMGAELLGGTKKHDTLRAQEFWAVNDINFKLKRSESLGLIGQNGAGKTTLLKLLNGLIKPDHGEIRMHGRVGALIALGAGFNPILTGRENIYVNGSVLGLTKKEIDSKIDEIIDFAEIIDFIDSPVQSYSSGMQVRLGFAVATALKPDILILDEVLAVGDRFFRAKCMARLSKILETTAVIIVSHEEAQIRQKCDTVLWLVGGRQKYIGPTREGLEQYMSNNKTGIRRETVTEPPIKTVTSQLQLEETQINQKIIIDIKIECAYEIEADYVVATFESASGQTAAQSMPNGLPFKFKKGLNILQLQYNELNLAPGGYNFSLCCTKNNGKTLLFNAINNASFHISGSDFLWSSYQPPLNSKLENI